MLESPSITTLLRLALDEDMPCGDVTTESIGGLPEVATGVIVTKQDCRACGLSLVSQLSELVSDSLAVDYRVEEGADIRRGDTLLQIEGPLEKILLVERTALNFLQHLSGVATHVASLVKKSGGITLLDTRKTLPGYRELEKHAVRVGGATNHRQSLSDQILIKDNHIDGSGCSAAELVRRAKTTRPDGCLIEVELRTFDELGAVIEEKPDIILLDNMSGEELERSVAFIRKASSSILVEVSGNITEERFGELQKLDRDIAVGVPGIRASLGALTYGAERVDLSLTIARDR